MPKIVHMEAKKQGIDWRMKKASLVKTPIHTPWKLMEASTIAK